MTNTISNPAKMMIGAVAAGSLVAFGVASQHLQGVASSQLPLIMGMGMVASRFKVKLPGVMGNMSGSVPVVLLAILRLPLLGTLMVAAACALSQSYAAREKRPRPVQFFFNACTLVNASALAYSAFHYAAEDRNPSTQMLMLVAAAVVYFVANTIPVAAIIAITEQENVFSLWRKVFLWSFPNYVIGAGSAAIISAFGNTVGWLSAATLLSALFAVYQCYKAYVSHSQPQLHEMAMSAAAGR